MIVCFRSFHSSDSVRSTLVPIISTILPVHDDFGYLSAETLNKSSAIDRIFVVTSPSVPATQEYLEKKGGVEVITAPGLGCVCDRVHGIIAEEIEEPVLVVMSDLPLIPPDMIDMIVSVYEK